MQIANDEDDGKIENVHLRLRCICHSSTSPFPDALLCIAFCHTVPVFLPAHHQVTAADPAEVNRA